MARHTLSQQEYDEFCRFLAEASGIELGPGKQYLVSSRLGRLLDEHGLDGFSALTRRLQDGADNTLRQQVVDAMTTNETMWFRDTYPFEMLKHELLPELGAGSGPLRIWSAACSSGQEAYSISMVVSEFNVNRPGVLRRPVEIVGTDISPSMLQIARSACYEELAVRRGLSAERLQRFFRQRGGCWEVVPEVRKRVRFTELNLLSSYVLLGRFDIVFCRNVLIYFSPDVKRDILRRIAQALNPGGYLFLGGSESPSGYTDAFELRRLPQGVIYQRRPDWRP